MRCVQQVFFIGQAPKMKVVCEKYRILDIGVFLNAAILKNEPKHH